MRSIRVWQHDPVARQNKHREKPELGLVLRAIGPLALWLRTYWILAIAIFLGAVFNAYAALALTSPEWIALRITAGVVGAAAVIADRIADAYEKKLNSITFRESERSAERAVENVNIFLSEAIEAMFLEGSAREASVRALKRTLVRCAAGAIGDLSRASYYPMRRVEGGSRILDRPSHHTEHGRYDKPDRPFIEAEDPVHEVWAIMDRADEEPEVRSEGEAVYGVDWTKKKYKTFYSVPVKANMVQFGFLSVNNAKVGAIGGPQRAAVLAMARTMALVIAFTKGPRSLNTQAGYYEVSADPANVSASTEEVGQ